MKKKQKRAAKRPDPKSGFEYRLEKVALSGGGYCMDACDCGKKIEEAANKLGAEGFAVVSVVIGVGVLGMRRMPAGSR